MSAPLRVNRPSVIPLAPRQCASIRHHGAPAVATHVLLDPYGGRYVCCASCADAGLKEWTGRFDHYVATGDWIDAEAAV